MGMTEQEKREKVIKGLKAIVNDDWMWKNAGYCVGICKDALALLKAQEPIQIIKVGYYDHGKCPKCDRYVSRYSNFCWYCGQAVKWE